MTKKKKLKKPKRKKSAVQTFFQTFMIAFLLFVVLCTPVRGLVGGVSEYKPFKEPDPVTEEKWKELVSPHSEFFREYEDSKRINVLLLGVNEPLTDTIMLVSFDPEKKKVDIISVPRDTYYPRSGYNNPAEKKINAAYRKDPVNTAEAVSDVLLGIPINYYAIVSYEGVEEIVNTMGGVPMNIEFHMLYDDPYDKPPLHINIPKGQQTLDGEHAVQFLRYRYGYVDGDIGRVKAQQEFMKSAFRQCLGFDLPKIAKTVFENIESNLDMGAMLRIAAKGIGMSSSSISTYTIPFDPEPEPPYYVYPKPEEVADMLTEIYSGKKVPTGGAIESNESDESNL